jgi:hypothetical protein
MYIKSNYAIDVAKAIIDLELIKQEAFSGKSFSKRICHCKAIIIDNYITVCQLLYIRITSKVIKYIEDLYNGKITSIDSILREKIFGFTTLKEWFKYYAYIKLAKYEYVSKKILIIFNKIQSIIDNSLFDYFENEYRKFINEILNEINHADEELLYKSLKDLYLNMRNWFETSIFNIIGINVDCNNIKDDIFDEFDISKDLLVNKNFCLQECLSHMGESSHKKPCNPDCLVNCKDKRCITHDYITNTKEFIHLIILPEMLMKGNNWFTNYIDTFKKYHTNPKSIDFIVDYMLLEEDFYKWNNDTLFRLNLLIDVFDRIYVINHNHIDKSQIIDAVQDKLIFDVVPEYFDLNINDLKFDKEKEQNKNN